MPEEAMRKVGPTRSAQGVGEGGVEGERVRSRREDHTGCPAVSAWGGWCVDGGCAVRRAEGGVLAGVPGREGYKQACGSRDSSRETSRHPTTQLTVYASQQHGQYEADAHLHTQADCRVVMVVVGDKQRRPRQRHAHMPSMQAGPGGHIRRHTQPTCQAAQTSGKRWSWKESKASAPRDGRSASRHSSMCVTKLGPAWGPAASPSSAAPPALSAPPTSAPAGAPAAGATTEGSRPDCSHIRRISTNLLRVTAGRGRAIEAGGCSQRSQLGGRPTLHWRGTTERGSTAAQQQ